MMPSSSKAWNYVAVLLLWLYWSSVPLGADGASTDPVEVAALREIKESLVDINKNLSDWSRGDPCTSNWAGVFCSTETMEDGYFHVTELRLLNMNLSGILSPELGRLSQLQILDFMWNNMSGSIPKEIGNIKTLRLLLLNGNQLTGSLPDELGYLPNLNRIQIDQNQISGPLPASFANLNNTVHFHMNNNSISGQIPPELSRLPNLVHFLLDNNNLSGYLPPEFYQLPNLGILQVDNNHFEGSTIPATYANMSKLLKLSLRNCGLQGKIPDLSAIPNLGYLDLSSNQLNGSIPRNKLSSNVTTINLSNNSLTGTIPTYFADLPLLQKLFLADNALNGSLPSTIWQNKTLNATETLILDFQNNQLSNISGSTNLPANVSLWLRGNPVCSNADADQFCGSQNDAEIDVPGNLTFDCPPQCPAPYEYSPTSPVDCFCAAPLIIDFRLKSPGFSYFNPYMEAFEVYMATGLNLELYQLYSQHFKWENGPRLRMALKLYPVYRGNGTNSNAFNASEVQRIVSVFTGWKIKLSDIFGPYELMSITLLAPYRDVFPTSTKSVISKGALVGIILGAIAGVVILSAVISLIIVRLHWKGYRAISKRHHSSRISIKIEGVRSFTFEEMALATNNFNDSTQVGQGGYGKVYKGILADGTVVAIKRAQQGSLQGEKEFLTEIQFLSRLHHRNLVSLVGYCDEEGEQMLVYEFMVNGTLRNHLSVKSKEPLGFAMRLSIALGSAKGILYLHTEADPPVFHRDIKASNILLDHKFTAKVADFGLSRLAPVADVEGIVPAHVSTVVKGTPGYLDPEYFLTHKLTDKSDVYSLGVVFLELLTGMQPISHGKNIVREVNVSYQSGMIFSVIDGRMGSYPSECVEKFVTLALKCCQDVTEPRPSMAEVVRELENIWLMMPDSDSKTTKFTSSDQPNKEVSPPYSSSSMKQQPYVSLDISGSNLVSGVIPSITAR